MDWSSQWSQFASLQLSPKHGPQDCTTKNNGYWGNFGRRTPDFTSTLTGGTLRSPTSSLEVAQSVSGTLPEQEGECAVVPLQPKHVDCQTHPSHGTNLNRDNSYLKKIQPSDRENSKCLFVRNYGEHTHTHRPSQYALNSVQLNIPFLQGVL